MSDGCTVHRHVSNRSQYHRRGNDVPRQRKRDTGGILEDYFNRRTLADYLNVAVSTIARWRHDDEAPPSIWMGGQLLYRKSDVAKWLEQQHKIQAAKAQKRGRGRPRKRLRDR
jgi:predicted DNA-binding transcriptional regulator AlpA